MSNGKRTTVSNYCVQLKFAGRKTTHFSIVTKYVIVNWNFQQKKAWFCKSPLYDIVPEYVLILFRFYRRIQSENKLKHTWCYGSPIFIDHLFASRRRRRRMVIIFELHSLLFLSYHTIGAKSEQSLILNFWRLRPGHTHHSQFHIIHLHCAPFSRL